MLSRADIELITMVTEADEGGRAQTYASFMTPYFAATSLIAVLVDVESAKKPLVPFRDLSRLGLRQRRSNFA
jgi:hypothetical protein